MEKIISFDRVLEFVERKMREMDLNDWLVCRTLPHGAYKEPDYSSMAETALDNLIDDPESILEEYEIQDVRLLSEYLESLRNKIRNYYI